MKHAVITTMVLLGGLTAFPALLDAQRTGVGVTTGTIEMHEPLKPGEVHRLPPIGVRNTGEVPADYTVTVTFHADQEELRPDQEWFDFAPSTLFLEAGELGSIQPVLTLPVGTEPGDYFAYLEVSPERSNEAGGTRIGVAAATRLHFSVEPANIFQAMYHRGQYLWNEYAPWTQVALAVLTAALLFAIARRFFAFNIQRRPHNE